MRELNPIIKTVGLLSIFFVAIFAVIFGSQAVRAESNPIANNATPVVSDSPATWYAYVKAGESISYTFQSNVSVPFDTTIVVNGMNGVHDEVLIPQGTSTATVYTDTFTATTTGVWSIALDPVSTQNLLRFKWDVTVKDSGNTAIPGRVWQTKYNIQQNPPIANSADITLWYLREDGYKYEATFRDYNGINSEFQSNSIGIVKDGTCTPAYRSVYGQFITNGDNPQNEDFTYETAPDSCTRPYKIFFAAPAADLPVSAPRWDGTTEMIAPSVQPAAISNLTFNYSGDQTKLSGAIHFNIANYLSTAHILIDTNGNGNFNDAVDRELYATINTGDTSYSLAFDGLDGQGNPIAVNTPLTIRVLADRPGEIHFVNGDVERRAGGIEVQRLNGSATNRMALSWNDSFLAPARCNAPAGPDMIGNMVDSTGGVHAWTNDTCPSLGNINGGPTSATDASWGDARAIDDWTWDTQAEVKELSITLAPEVTITKTTSNPTPAIGQNFTYTLKVANSGQIGTYGTLTTQDTLPASITVSADSLPNGCSITGQIITCETTDTILPGNSMTYNFTAKATQAGQDLVNMAVVFGGGDDECTSPSDLVERCQSSATVTAITAPNTGLFMSKASALLNAATIAVGSISLLVAILLCSQKLRTQR